MNSLQRFLLVLALIALWSPSFLFIKLAIQELPPFTIVTLRVSIAAMVIMGILYWRKVPLPTNRVFWFHSTMMALLASVIPFCLFCYAEQYIESALAAILNGCTPMFTALLAQFLLPSDRLNMQKVIGIFLSASGLLLLFTPNLIQGLSGTSSGILAGAGAAFSYAASHIYAKKFATGQVPFVAPAAQLISSSLIMTPLAFWFDSPLSLSFPSSNAILGVLGLAFFGTVIAFIIYYRLIEASGPTAVSTVACFFPVGGMILGFLFLGESFNTLSVMASSLILLGLMTVNDLFSFKFRSRPAMTQEMQPVE